MAPCSTESRWCLTGRPVYNTATHSKERGFDRAKMDAEAGDSIENRVAFVFNQIRAATRKAGEMYAGRTLVYEDCRRDYELQLGRAVLDQLGPPLALVLQSARWYTHEMATRVLGALDAVYDQLCRECGETVIAYPRFFDRAAPHLPAEGDAVVGDVVAELHRRWRDVLAFDDGERRVTRTTAALGEPVRRAFAAPAPGWPGAQFHAPDVMIGARSVEDVLAGRGTIVLGEVHTGRTTVTIPLFLKECPDAEAVRAAERADARVPRVRPVLPKRMATRVDAGRGADRDFEIELGTTPSHLPRDRVLAAGELVVERMSRGLVVRTRDGGVVLDAIVFFEIYLQVSTDQHWTMLGEQPHEPRVTIDGVVMSRERWRFARSELPFADAPRGLAQLAAARKWATDHGLPRCVFAKVPDERKPVFVDLASPVYVEQLAKLARSSPSFAISEMLPGLDELWLADAEDHRYTCELRMNVVDPVAWCPPGVR